ncbi:MAG: hypothetical protein ACKVJX_18745 [Verrucomicrobiia bacterium]
MKSVAFLLGFDFIHQGASEQGLITSNGKAQQRPFRRQRSRHIREAGRGLQQKLNRSQFAQPEIDIRGNRGVPTFLKVNLHQPLNHRPVLCALRLFRRDQIAHAKQIDREVIKFNHGPPFPQQWKSLDAAQTAHQIDPKIVARRRCAAQMNSQPFIKMPNIKRRNGDGFRCQSIRCLFQSFKIPGIRQHHEIDVFAEFRRSIKNTCLPAGQQTLNAMLPKCAKDLLNAQVDHRPALSSIRSPAFPRDSEMEQANIRKSSGVQNGLSESTSGSNDPPICR